MADGGYIIGNGVTLDFDYSIQNLVPKPTDLTN